MFYNSGEKAPADALPSFAYLSNAKIYRFALGHHRLFSRAVAEYTMDETVRIRVICQNNDKVLVKILVSEVIYWGNEWRVTTTAARFKGSKKMYFDLSDGGAKWKKS